MLRKTIFSIIFITKIAIASISLNFDQQQRYQNLLEQYRCLVCQNQTLLDSDASFAKDIRYKIAEKIYQNKTDLQIEHYLVDLYGPAIRVAPPINEHWLLWTAPLWILIGLIMLLKNNLNNKP